MRAAAVIALLASGCSLTLIKAPPSEPRPQVYPECHESPAAVVADVLFAVLSGAVVVAAADEDAQTDDETGTMVLFGGLAVLHTVSAAVGVRWTSRCSRLHTEWEGTHPAEPIRIAPLRRPPPRPVDGAAGAACFGNRTCNDGLSCGPGNRCVAGDRGLEGMPCFDDGSCSGDLACVSALCARPPPAECKTDAHCPEGLGLICRDGYCVSPPVAP